MQISCKTKHRETPCGYIRKDIYGVYKLVFINRTNRKHTANMLKELDSMIINCLRKHGFRVGSMYMEGRIRTPKVRKKGASSNGRTGVSRASGAGSNPVAPNCGKDKMEKRNITGGSSGAVTHVSHLSPQKIYQAIEEIEREIRKESKKAKYGHTQIHLRGEWYAMQKLREKLDKLIGGNL